MFTGLVEEKGSGFYYADFAAGDRVRLCPTSAIGLDRQYID